jgi:hypothetical protein
MGSAPARFARMRASFEYFVATLLSKGTKYINKNRKQKRMNREMYL